MEAVDSIVSRITGVRIASGVGIAVVLAVVGIGIYFVAKNSYAENPVAQQIAVKPLPNPRDFGSTETPNDAPAV